MTRFLFALVLVGCAGNGKKDHADPAKDPEPTAEPAPAPAPPPVPVATPAELYGQCKDRMESPEGPSECTTDAECGTAGCGGEVCTTAAKKGEVTTTCDAQLCFKVVDACGCHDGRCTWTLLPEVPASVTPTSPGNMLPPTKPAEPPPGQ